MKRNMSEQVTWLLPVKNGMPYLSETLASIEAQTYKSWEVLVWDNGSTDGTVEELKKWIPSRLPGRVVTDSPLPLGESLAEMVRQANTEFCARIDADDINFPERLEKQVGFLLKNPDVAVLGSQIECIDNRGKKHRERLEYPLHHDDIVHTMLRVCAMSHPAITFRRSAILEIGNYRDVFVAGQRSPSEDYDLWLRIATSFKLANLDLTLLKYRIHERSINQISGAENQAIQVQNDCFCRNAPLLYGCSEEDARLIREWRHPDPVEVLIQIAAYLDAHQKSDLQDRLRSQSFIGAGREMMSSKDIISCLRWATLNQNKLAILGEFCTIARRGQRFFRFPKMLNPQNQDRSCSRSLIMKVSVIISNYNYGQYLPAAIASVLAQTYQNFEIIVVDDGSTDNSREVLTQLQQQALDKIKPIFQANQGQGAAFNTAFDVSTGDIIAFLDADDTWKPEKLQQIVQVFQQSDAVGVMHVLEQVDAEGNPLPAKPARPLPTGNIATTMISTGNACWFPPTSGLSYRRSVLKKVLPMDTTKWRLCADGCLVYCIAFLGNITSLNDALGSYRLHGANNYFTLKQPSVAAVTKTLAGIEMTNQYLNEFLEEIGYPGRVDLSRNLQYRRTRFYHNGQWNTKEVAAICGLILTWCLYTWQERLYFLGRFLLKSTSFLVYPIRSIEKTTS